MLKIGEEYQTSENGVGGIKSMAVQLYTPLEYSEIIWNITKYYEYSEN